MWQKLVKLSLGGWQGGRGSTLAHGLTAFLIAVACGGSTVGSPGPAAANTPGSGGSGALRQSACQRESIKVFPSELSQTDRCVAVHACESGVTLTVDCDGENDGTNTSLCNCIVDGKNRSPDHVITGEAPESCHAALPICQSLFHL
jgi:hypothetical protein